jgi:putative tricarboxylic transport membrane protein
MKISDTLVGAGFVGAGALVFAGTLGYPSLDASHPGPALFPRLLAGLMAGLGGLLAARGLRERDASDALDWRGLHRSPGFVNALWVLAGVVAYVALVERAGFLLMSSVLIGGLMWRLGVRPLRALAVAVAFTLVVHFLFAKILRVPLPLGLLWW